MVLYFIGLGLSDEKDITVRGLEVVKRCQRVYLEAYTSILMVEKERLEAFYGREVIIADRGTVESEADAILHNAGKEDVAFLVVGDPFGATTHSDLQLRAESLGIAVKVIHNASIMNAVGISGLQLYRFGEVKHHCLHDMHKGVSEAVSIVFFTETWRPDSFYARILANRRQGLHTLCLLDIKVKEPTLESLARGKKVYEPPRYMSIGTAVEQLLEVEEKLQGGAYDANTMCVGLARVGSDDQHIYSGSMESLKHVDFGSPLHSLIICGTLHTIEEQVLNLHRQQPQRQQQS